MVAEHGARAEKILQEAWTNPPPVARLHAYWWWLNGNVTQAAITRDLEAMKEKGFGGALIMDSGGAEQDGNRPVPHGPDFASPEWRALFRHALREGNRLGLELALNIQSGWNLGGPSVTPPDAAKILCWTETALTGPGRAVTNLPAPTARSGLLQEVAVVAVPDRAGEDVRCQVTVSSAHSEYPATRLSDGDTNTFWVSDGVGTGKDPLAWIRLAFAEDRTVSSLELTGRPGHGPKGVEAFALGADGTRRRLGEGRPERDRPWRATWDPPQAVRQLEIRVTDAYDRAGGLPRNVQVAEIAVEGPGWRWPARPVMVPDWEVKSLYRPLSASAPDTSRLLWSGQSRADTSRLDLTNIVDVTSFVDASGKLTWSVPKGHWRVFRLCYTVAPHASVSTASQGWGGLALDPMDEGAFQRYWDAVVEPLVQDAEAVGGKCLKYLHTDSWEIEPYNWTARFPAAFRARCGYDLRPWLPVLAGCPVGGVEASERFLHDFRKTVAALTAENHFGSFLTNAHRHGLQVRAESGGPHAVPIDAQHCLGMIDVPMSEFWASSWRHRVSDGQRFFVKQPAMAAHTYGRPIVAAEGFTTIGPQWQERVWSNLKPAFDRALCEGLNQLVWTLVTCSPGEMGLPGQDMFAGTHFNPNSTWWRQSEGLLSYINRCQWLLRQGHFVADVLYYYGDHAPNFAQLRQSNPAGLPPGHDYDVATEYVLLNRVAVKDGRIVLPDGMSYGALALAPHRSISLPVLRKLRSLAEAGAVILGARPESSSGLADWLKGDTEVRALIDTLWGGGRARTGLVRFPDAVAWLKATGLPADFAPDSATEAEKVDYIHRQDGATDIYFVANRGEQPLRARMRFRVKGKTPEFWDPRDGTVRWLPEWRALEDGRMEVPLELEAFGSGFIVFHEGPTAGPVRRADGHRRNFPIFESCAEITGPWEVTFDPAWFYPDTGAGSKRVFAKLDDWSQRPEEAVRYYSGAATYRTSFDGPSGLTGQGKEWFLSLGDVREMARVRLNGRDLGVVWSPPWRVRIPAGVLLAKGNRLEIEVVNFWPNRLMGDARLPLGQRRTRTNISKFDQPKGDAHYTALMPSGLLGPVTLNTE